MKIKHNYLLVVLICLAFLGGLMLYPALPDQIPTHWNIKGEIDDYGSKNFTALGFPLIILGLYLLLTYLPLIDPRKENYVKFATTYNLIKWIIVLFMLVLYGLMLAVAMGYPVKVDLVVRAGVSLLLIFLGNYLGKVRPNYFVGIRTPWTLADEEVWLKTHRFGAKVFVLTGVLGILTIPFGITGAYINFGLFMLPITTVVYSYIEYRKKQRPEI